MAANISNNITRPAGHGRSRDRSRDLSPGTAVRAHVRLGGRWEPSWGSKCGGEAATSPSQLGDIKRL